jgi:hypothetical protein
MSGRYLLRRLRLDPLPLLDGLGDRLGITQVLPADAA